MREGETFRCVLVKSATSTQDHKIVFAVGNVAEKAALNVVGRPTIVPFFFIPPLPFLFLPYLDRFLELLE